MCAQRSNDAASTENAGSPRDNSWMSPYTSRNPDLYFLDGKRRIDFVLVYDQYADTFENAEKRNAFLAGLAKEMVEVEVEDCFGRVLGCTRSFPPPEEEIQPTVNPHLQSAPPPVDPNIHSILTKGAAQSDDKHPSNMDRYRLRAEVGDKNIIGMSELVFVKLYAPWPTMERYAEMFNFRKPLRTYHAEELAAKSASTCSPCCDMKEDKKFPQLRTTFTWPFQKQRQYLFDIPENRDEFFSASERALVLDYILRRTRCIYKTDETDDNVDDDEDILASLEKTMNEEQASRLLNIGITKLISDGVFTAAYPLHEFNEKVQEYYDNIVAEPSEDTPRPSQEEDGKINNRILLRRNWASYKSFVKFQPLDYIRYYFGEAIAFYFAWLGFYTTCLVPVAALGLCIFLVGLLGITSDPAIEDVCKYGNSTVMCPMCSKKLCKFWKLSDACFRSKLSHLVDNEGTVLFGVIMALWAILFLELWKRKQITLAYRWNVYALEPVDQPARPEFLALLQKGYRGKINPVSNHVEPMVPFWRRRVPCFLISYSVVLFAVVLTLAFLVGVILYKLVMKFIFYRQPNALVQSTAGMLATITGSVINLICIFILKFIYDRIAVKMTDLEHHRTQVEYDSSLTLKLYMLQFVNYYSSIFYIAFIQGNTAALPGSEHSIVQSMGCDQGDCLFELFLQLVIIMVGKQLLSFIQEALMPILLRLFHKMRAQCKRKNRGESPADLAAGLESIGMVQAEPLKSRLLACRSDYTLLNPGSRPLFDEYLEMMIQFGFITMFVPAFPLAPFFGLLNNLFELRGDAKKFVNQYRRPVAERVKTIGVWFSILMVLSSIAIRTNACIIAFTTQFIDRWVYRVHYSPDKTNVGFKNFTLSFMDSSRFSSNHSTPYCRYIDYRKPPWEDPQLNHTLVYYHVLAVKFIFVFIFETVAILLTSFIASLIADVPERVKKQVYREANETNRIILNAELRHQKSGGKGISANQIADDLRKDALGKVTGIDEEQGPMPLMPMEFYPFYQPPPT